MEKVANEGYVQLYTNYVLFLMHAMYNTSSGFLSTQSWPNDCHTHANAARKCDPGRNLFGSTFVIFLIVSRFWNICPV